MIHRLATLALLLVAVSAFGQQQAEYTGTQKCRQCHEKFYQLWAPSQHGKAMQSFTPEFAKEFLPPQTAPITIGDASYIMEVDDKGGRVIETSPKGEKTYPALHAMGGKTVFYFLTPMERGRLQVLPVAYDVKNDKWIDMAGSGVRHFAEVEDEPFHWTDWPYTFNTACHACHVSQIKRNYDLETDSYHTTWVEAGINCETCHGPAEEHVKLYLAAAETGETPEKMGLITVTQSRGFTGQQASDACSYCHAKMSPISAGLQPGDRLYDHADLVTYESIDYYPDGRDLGENYTYTSWSLNPCAKNGELDCVHCHTSSGRYRFKGETANNACLPCHEDRVKNAPKHTHHKADDKGNECTGCHMPMTDFARMQRSDHSMRPPAPSATLKFGSPNACNNCHDDEEKGWDAKWADTKVREWRKRDYQAPIVHQGELIAAARKADWKRLDEMLEMITEDGRSEIFANSMIRLLIPCRDERKWPVLIKTLADDSSPLVRSSAADGLLDYPDEAAIAALVDAAGDESRLVRVRAAYALAGVPERMIPKAKWASLSKATEEYLASITARLDDPVSHYNMGNYHMRLGRTSQAVEKFEIASRLRPEFVAPMVNASMAYNALGRNDLAEASLRRAIKAHPGNEAANTNLGMLLGELGRIPEATKAFRAALKTNPKSPVAAFNLGVLLAQENSEECLQWLRAAARANPENVNYAYSLAFYLRTYGKSSEAIGVLESLIKTKPPVADAYHLLASIYRAQRAPDEAARVFEMGFANDNLPDYERARFKGMR